MWFALVLAVEFCLIPVFVAACWRQFTKREAHYFAAATLFLVSTYFVSMTAGNNYSMRGMFLPSFVFFVLFAKYLPERPRVRRWLDRRSARVQCAALAVLLSVGTGIEVAAQV